MVLTQKTNETNCYHWFLFYSLYRMKTKDVWLICIQMINHHRRLFSIETESVVCEEEYYIYIYIDIYYPFTNHCLQ